MIPLSPVTAVFRRPKFGECSPMSPSLEFFDIPKGCVR
jgi:hypothetical protein